MTVRLLPEKRTRAPLELGLRPDRSSKTPALASSSLNLPIAASSFSSGSAPDSDFFVAFTITMNRIVVSPFWRPFRLALTLATSSGRPDRHDRRFSFLGTPLGGEVAEGHYLAAVA